MFFVILFLQLFSLGYAFENSDCLLREYGEGKKVCVCNSVHCDYLSVDITEEKINVFTSTQEGARYLKEAYEFSTTPTTENVAIIDRSQKYQSILGWGGALTDAAGINIKSLPEAAGEHLMRSYFTGAGSMYNLCRVPMGGTDFSTHGYSYNDGPADESLKNFALAPEDFEYKLPYMKMALNLSMYQTQLKFFTATWTAPKWMKANGDYSGVGGYLKEEYYQTWADYFVKFLQAYKDQGLDFWGISTGNEPLLAKSPVKINSVAWKSDTASLWIREHLGPTLRNSEFSNIKIMAIDDQRIFFPGYASNVMENNDTRNYIDGFAVHWYFDTFLSANLLTQTHDKFPDKFILSTEACNGFEPWNVHVDLGSWERGENYVTSIMEDLNNWVTGWVDWNMALDLQGGPTYISNFVDSPILVNATAGEFYKQPMYYAIGHFSKFVPEKSVRIGSTFDLFGVSMIVFERPEPDNKTVVVILNKLDEITPISIQDGERYINLDLKKKSMTTVVY